jgi:hypothetical protein
LGGRIKVSAKPKTEVPGVLEAHRVRFLIYDLGRGCQFQFDLPASSILENGFGMRRAEMQNHNYRCAGYAEYGHRLE